MPIVATNFDIQGIPGRDESKTSTRVNALESMRYFVQYRTPHPTVHTDPKPTDLSSFRISCGVNG